MNQVVLDWLLFAGTAAGMCAGCLVPNRWLPPLPNDKLMHFLGFALLTALGLRVAGDGAGIPLMLALLAAGWVIECLQALVGRGFCWRDMAANAAGIALVGIFFELKVTI